MLVSLQQAEEHRRAAEKKADAEERRELEVERRQREVCTGLLVC